MPLLESLANPRPARYTARQLAVLLRLGKRAVLKCLSESDPGRVVAGGNEAFAWSFDELPTGYQQKIVQFARAAGMTPAEYMEAGWRQWEPEIPISELAQECIDEAQRLRSALLPAFSRRGFAVLTPADHVRIGLEDYQRAFGHSISERHWLRLMERTERRDAGAKDFNRLELYLPDRLSRRATAARLLPDESSFKPLADYIRSFRDPAAPNRVEIAAFWHQVFSLYELLQLPEDEKRLRRALLKFLARHASWLADGDRALRVAFQRKYDRWTMNDRTAAALLDGREQKKGTAKATEIPANDIDRIVFHAAANCGGRIAQAKRELLAKGLESGLTESTLELLARPSVRKRYVNARLIKAVRRDVEQIAPFFLGKKAIDDATAHVERDYSKLASMEIINADDFTFPVYFYVPDGKGGFSLTRGQCLIMLDVRSWKIVAWSLQPERNYNSFVIRTLMNRVCESWGIPATWYFERGIWLNSNLVKGPPAGWNEALSWPQVEVGWQNLGVRFIHATRARSKPVERVGGLLQDLMEGIRGYCGRDERRDCPAVTKRAIDDFNAKRFSHPGELFLSFDEWEMQLAGLIDRYNASSQEGRVLAGFSPDEQFEHSWPHKNPPARMDANCWHLVAHYVRQLPVTANGITFRIGAKSFVYRNERTGQDRGSMVLGWFDPECPQFICVTDLERKNPYLVERANPVDFLAQPGDGNFTAELAKAAAHSTYPKARFHAVKAKFAPTFRRNVVQVETALTAQEIARQRQSLAAEQKEQRSARKAFDRLGMVAPDRLRPGQAEAAEGLADVLAELKEKPNE